MFRPFSGLAIIMLKLEYRRKLIHYKVEYISRMGERDLVLQWLERCVAIYTRCEICASYDFICRVFCGFVNIRAGVVFGSCFTGGISKLTISKDCCHDTAVRVPKSHVKYKILFDSAHIASKCTLLHASPHTTHSN
jgi:hypothetical protein